MASSILAAARQALGDVEALLLPVACLGCGAYLPPGPDRSPCCAVCRARMRSPAPPTCRRCGQPLDRWEAVTGAGGRPRGAASGGAGARVSAGRGAASPVKVCGFCRRWPHELAWAASAVWMDDGPARELVHALKYSGWRVAALSMAEVMARALGSRLSEVDCLVPVPLGRRRERRRGHNQAGVLADALGSAAGVRVEIGALRRGRETRSQTTLGPAGRWRNVAGAFAATADLSGTRVALVDDVLTTGATLAACATALAAGGAEAVGATTFARASIPS